jgi:putative endonuclease
MNRTGARAERRARLFYLLRGYRVLEANSRPGRVEVDLVLRRGRQVVFCEVKAKLGSRYGEPGEMVGRSKQQRLRRAAEAWLAAHPESAEWEVRFDVLAVTPRGVQRIANAF